MVNLYNLLSEVDREASRRTPDLLAQILSDKLPYRYCAKCRDKLVKYISLKLTKHHTNKRTWRHLHRAAAGQNQLSSFELDAKIASARADFYNTPCECGKREDYTP